MSPDRSKLGLKRASLWDPIHTAVVRILKCYEILVSMPGITLCALFAGPKISAVDGKVYSISRKQERQGRGGPCLIGLINSRSYVLLAIFRLGFYILLGGRVV